MEVWFPDGNGGRKLVNMAGTAAADTEEQTDETPALRTTALSRAAPLLASAGEDAEDDEAREIYYPDRDGGRVLLSTGGGITSLPTASASVKGAVMIGSGLAMDGDTLKTSLTSADLPASLLANALPVASTSNRGVIRVGNGLSMNGDVLNVTVQGGGGGGGTVDTFVGATSTSDGTGGAVPPPLAGQEHDFLCGNGTWTALTTTITIGTTPSTVDGAVWFSI